MHALMSRFWQPVAKSSEIEAGGAPLRVRLLGENYVVWRASDGRVGFFDEACPHRRASLALARNEDCALTCLFHGWKIDVTGKVVDVASEPAMRSEFGRKVEVRHFPVREAGGLVWAFVADGVPSQFPELLFTKLPPSHVHVTRFEMHCNWAQLVEGQLDSAHVGILHANNFMLAEKTGAGKQDFQKALGGLAPRYEFENNAWGFTAAAVRDLDDGMSYVRLTQFLMPCYTFIPATTFPHATFFQMPRDDEHTVQWLILYDEDKPLVSDGSGLSFDVAFDPKTVNFREAWTAQNVWGQDRAAMRAGHPTGLYNFLVEDFAISESMGPIVDRTQEYLSPNDAAVTRFRRLLLRAAQAVEDGATAPALGGDVPYDSIRARQFFYPTPAGWRAA
jgi:phenylpropionate dioxygenase-like ring-hydroxylating dioxygenase large terminal subunit